jgi:hypothetical protein
MCAINCMSCMDWVNKPAQAQILADRTAMKMFPGEAPQWHRPGVEIIGQSHECLQHMIHNDTHPWINLQGGTCPRCDHHLLHVVGCSCLALSIVANIIVERRV